MNKLLLAASAAVLTLGLAYQASADCNGLYLAGRGGIVKHKIENPKRGGEGNADNDFDKQKLMLSAALGYRYDYLRVEGEYVWRDKVKHHDTIDEDTALNRQFKSYSYMLNAYFDLAPYSWLTPYVGAGIGVTNLKYKEHEETTSPVGEPSSRSLKEDNFTWSVGGGLSVKVTNRFNVDAGYRYYDMGDLDKADVTAHEVYAGIRYVF